MKKEERTSIQVSMATKNRLDKIGLKKDTYNDILIRLLDQAKRQRRQKCPPPGREETIYPI